MDARAAWRWAVAARAGAALGEAAEAIYLFCTMRSHFHEAPSCCSRRPMPSTLPQRAWPSAGSWAAPAGAPFSSAGGRRRGPC
ncbi:MAG: hypothetical protein HGA45_35030 [Chloroflexales bacterium]|nr:hypothetical protein [Chloroflexales bacterium]